MQSGLFNVGLFVKNRDEIERRNYKALTAVGLVFVGISLLEFVVYFVFQPQDIPFVFAFYDLLIIIGMLFMKTFKGKIKDLCSTMSMVFYLIGMVFVCHTHVRLDDNAVLVNYGLVTLTLSMCLLLQPFVLIMLHVSGLVAVMITEYVMHGQEMNYMFMARYLIVCLLDVTISIIATYIRMENILFQKSLFSMSDESDVESYSVAVDPKWSGRNKYGILSGQLQSTRRVFGMVFDLSKEKLIRIRKQNIWNLQTGMSLDEAREIMLETCIDPISRKRISHFMDIDELFLAYKQGKRRVSCIAGFRLENNDTRWLDIECIMDEHPLKGQVYASVVVEDITEDRILMGVLNKIVEQNYDCVVCIEKQKRKTIMFKVEPGQEIKGEYRPSYDEESKDYINKYVHHHDKTRMIKLFDFENVQRVLADNPKHEFLLDAIDDGGLLHKKLFQFSYLDPARNFIIMIKQDVTDVIVKEDAAKAALAKALSEKETAMNARSEFMTRMSHEMRTPMNAILGLSTLMMDEINNPDAMRAYISKVQYSGKFLLQLINDVLDITKMEQNKFQINEVPYSFGEFWEAVDTMVGPMCLKKGVDFEWKSSIPEGWTFMTDPLRLTQIFINLLSNAVKYTPKGGHIVFECKEKELEGDMSRFTFVVKDDGIGMSQEFQQRMFDPFTQESKEINTDLNGTGLGLSIVKGIVEALNGKITCKSEQGKGTTFKVVIDMKIASEGPRLRPLDATINIEGKRILVVEDNDINREIAVAILEKKGVITEVAVNGQEAVEQFSLHTPGYYDMILMDIRMPVMSGLTATKRIRAMERDDAKAIPIVAMTANAFSKDVAASKDAGLNEHLSKPIEPKILYRTIAKYTT